MVIPVHLVISCHQSDEKRTQHVSPKFSPGWSSLGITHWRPARDQGRGLWRACWKASWRRGRYELYEFGQPESEFIRYVMVVLPMLVEYYYVLLLTGDIMGVKLQQYFQSAWLTSYFMGASPSCLGDFNGFHGHHFLITSTDLWRYVQPHGLMQPGEACRKHETTWEWHAVTMGKATLRDLFYRILSPPWCFILLETLGNAGISIISPKSRPPTSNGEEVSIRNSEYHTEFSETESLKMTRPSLSYLLYPIRWVPDSPVL